jgi:hypothetical protein
VADSAGRFGSIFLGVGVTYKVILTDANDVTIWTRDPVAAPAGTSEATQAEVDARTSTTKFVSPAKIADGVGLQGSSIASAAALTLPSVGDYFSVTGTTTIASISSRAAGREITLVFAAALTLTNSASLILPGGVDFGTAPGVVMRLRSEGSGVWRCVASQRTGNAVVQDLYTSTAVFNGALAAIPYDDTIPASTEGTQVLSQAIVPKRAGNAIEVFGVLYMSRGTGSGQMVAAVFDGGASAVAVGTQAEQSGTPGTVIVAVPFEYRATASGTSSVTYSVRAGGEAANCGLNGTGAGSRKFGGALISWMRVREIAS